MTGSSAARFALGAFTNERAPSEKPRRTKQAPEANCAHSDHQTDVEGAVEPQRRLGDAYRKQLPVDDPRGNTGRERAHCRQQCEYERVAKDHRAADPTEQKGYGYRQGSTTLQLLPKVGQLSGQTSYDKLRNGNPDARKRAQCSLRIGKLRDEWLLVAPLIVASSCDETVLHNVLTGRASRSDEKTWS
jgi:hypothetical protein